MINYKPNNFDPEKMHSLKYLWIFERRSEIIREALDDLDFDERLKALPKAMYDATERIQMETGMSNDELRKAIFIGTYIAEFQELQKMSDDEAESYLNFIEESEGVPDDVVERFGEVLEELHNVMNPEGVRESFYDIIGMNFGDDDDQRNA